METKGHIPFNSEVHEPPPTGVFLHLGRVPGYPAVFTILDGDPEIVERPEEADMPFHVLWRNERPLSALCTDDIHRRSGGGVTRRGAGHIGEDGAKESRKQRGLDGRSH